MKKIITVILAIVLMVTCIAVFAACNTASNSGKNGKSEGENGKTNNGKTNADIVVYTNAFFAPFEYYDGTEIVGVDVEIMNKVGEKMNKKVTIEDKDFSILIDAVKDGKLCDCAAAGITITDPRKEKVNFSIPYYTSVQYVIFKKGTLQTSVSEDGSETTCVFWDQLAGKTIGVQLDTTGDIYVGIEINGEEGYEGVLQGKGAKKDPLETAQLAYEKLKAGHVDVVVIDELPAQYLIKNDTAEYACAALYYDAETATSEEYAIAVNKNQTELLEAINEVLDEMIKDVDEKGDNAIIRLVAKHFGIQ